MPWAPDLAGFFLPIMIRQTATTPTPLTVWTMRNTHATRAVTIKRIYLAPFQDQALAGLFEYDLVRFSGATPTGGVALAPIEMRTSSVWVSAVTDARVFDTGLTVGGVTFETAFAVIRAGATSAAGNLGLNTYPFDLNMLDNNRNFSGFELSPGEGFAIRLPAAPAAAVIGTGLAGYVFWDERL